jgi:3-methyl-2-oxobutanoate hydroxymethyltransferase
VNLKTRLKQFKQRPLTMVTCYDSAMAKLLDESVIDLVLVGDSVAQVVHGFKDTSSATIEMMELHTQAVCRGLGAESIPVVSDMPFASVRQGVHAATRWATQLVRAGAQAVKIEALTGHQDVVEHLVGTGIPVMGHLGLTPQYVNEFGGYKVQAKTFDAAAGLLKQAHEYESLGACALVLECVPAPVAAQVAHELEIPVIGIGAGAEVDGQVLVMHDLLGLSVDFKARFVRHFGSCAVQAQAAFRSYAQAVRLRQFPNAGESFETEFKVKELTDEGRDNNL